MTPHGTNLKKDTTMTPNFDVATKAIQNAAEQARTGFEAIVKNGQQQMADAQERFVSSVNEYAGFSKANVEAALKAGNVVYKAAEVASREVAGFAQSQVEKNLDAGKAMMTAKSVQQLVEMQNALVKGNMDALYAQSIKLSQMSVSIANEAFAPIGARMNAVVEKFARPLAA